LSTACITDALTIIRFKMNYTDVEYVVLHYAEVIVELKCAQTIMICLDRKNYKLNEMTNLINYIFSIFLIPFEIRI